MADWVSCQLDEADLSIDMDCNESDPDHELNLMLKSSPHVRAKMFCMPLHEFRSELISQSKYLTIGSAREMQQRVENPCLLQKAVFLVNGIVSDDIVLYHWLCYV